MKRIQIIIFFLLSSMFLVYLLLDEPYPALILPSFVGGIDKDFEEVPSPYHLAIIHSKGDTTQSNFADLFQDADSRYSYHIFQKIKLEYLTLKETKRSTRKYGFHIDVFNNANREYHKNDFHKWLFKTINNQYEIESDSITFQEISRTFNIHTRKYSLEKITTSITVPVYE